MVSRRLVEHTCLSLIMASSPDSRQAVSWEWQSGHRRMLQGRQQDHPRPPRTTIRPGRCLRLQTWRDDHRADLRQRVRNRAWRNGSLSPGVGWRHRRRPSRWWLPSRPRSRRRGRQYRCVWSRQHHRRVWSCRLTAPARPPEAGRSHSVVTPRPSICFSPEPNLP